MNRGGLIFAAAFSIATPAAAQLSPYAVIFEVNARPDGQVENLIVSKVIDARTGSTNAIDMKVPFEFVQAVRAKLNAKYPPPTKQHSFTYFFFDPNDPINAENGAGK